MSRPCRLKTQVWHSSMLQWLVLCTGDIPRHSELAIFCFFALLSHTISAQIARLNSLSTTAAICTSLLRMFDVRFFKEFCLRCKASITCRLQSESTTKLLSSSMQAWAVYFNLRRYKCGYLTLCPEIKN